MKKRVKLLTTIASLCLAVALMAFGVYAASNATLDVTSTVAFETTNVSVTYTVDVVHTANVTVTGQDAGNYTAETKTYHYERVQGTQNNDDTTQLKLGAYSFTEAATTADYVEYTFVIQNTSSVDYTVAFTGTLPANEDGDSVKITVTNETGAIDNTIAAGATETLKIKYEMLDNAKDFDTSTIALKWVITK